MLEKTINMQHCSNKGSEESETIVITEVLRQELYNAIILMLTTCHSISDSKISVFSIPRG